MNFFTDLRTRGGNFVSRLGGFGDESGELLGQQQLAQLTPEQREIYNQRRAEAQKTGMRELAARLSDAFAGRDVIGRAKQREQARDVAEIKQYERQKRTEQQELNQFKKEIKLPEGLTTGAKILFTANKLSEAGFVDASLPYFELATKYKDTLTDEDKFKFEKDLRAEYDKKEKDFRLALDQTRTTKKALEQGTGIADIQAVFSFMKAVDPGSRVTEGEIELTANAGGKLRTLAAFANKAATGKVFDPKTRQEMWQLMSEVSRDTVENYKNLQTRYSNLATEYGVDSENVITPYSFDFETIFTPLYSGAEQPQPGGGIKNKKF